MRAEVLVGVGLPVDAPVLRLDEPLSFWGGVDPATERLSDRRSKFYGHSVAGAVLMVPEPRGSSSSSAVILELLYRGLGPAALVLGDRDAIVGLGILVAIEMGFEACPLLLLDAASQRSFPDGGIVRIDRQGRLVPDDRGGAGRGSPVSAQPPARSDPPA